MVVRREPAMGRNCENKNTNAFKSISKGIHQQRIKDQIINYKVIVTYSLRTRYQTQFGISYFIFSATCDGILLLGVLTNCPYSGMSEH